jgi:RimJ/RimL family protein N-acetyltransferase
MLNSKLDLSVRVLEIKDISSIADYWLLSSPKYLKSLGVDLTKVPSRDALTDYLTNQIKAVIEEKKSYALVWELNGKAIGHSNVNELKYGETAKMHLHLWNQEFRNIGIGFELLKMSIPFYFNELRLKELICEPFADNPAPNKTLSKLGFKFITKHTIIPGSLNFEQEVNQWRLIREDFF